MPIEIRQHLIAWTTFDVKHLLNRPAVLSKLFVMSQQTFTCSNSTRETIEVYVVLMSLLLTLNIIHTIF